MTKTTCLVLNIWKDAHCQVGFLVGENPHIIVSDFSFSIRYFSLGDADSSLEISTRGLITKHGSLPLSLRRIPHRHLGILRILWSRILLFENPPFCRSKQRSREMPPAVKQQRSLSRISLSKPLIKKWLHCGSYLGISHVGSLSQSSLPSFKTARLCPFVVTQHL